jgi:uncharacterized protein YbgA (DUF1722 family)
MLIHFKKSPANIVTCLQGPFRQSISRERNFFRKELYTYIIVEGTATLSADLDMLLHWATRIGGRYMGEELAETYGKRNGVPGELLVKLTPTKVMFEKDTAS